MGMLSRSLVDQMVCVCVCINLPQPSLILLECAPIAIVNILEPASDTTQCNVDPVCVSIELLLTAFNLPQPSVVLI